MISIIDYGMGNLRSVQKAFERVGARAQIVTAAEQIRNADKIVLPGVGAFRDAMAHLHDQGLTEAVVEAARSGRPFLGICLGLQMLFDVSHEDGEYRGLGIIPGRVLRFDFSDLPGGRELKIPHMGWNRLNWERPCPLMAGLDSGTWFYFVHSYYVVPAEGAASFGTCEYGRPFTAMIWRDNLFATQFHPEKSQEKGLLMLRNFATL
ncbi:MAG TPA: imidazole glycerol phosphate synthase subunit HisH [Phycisphaerae bacterium]|nr:imidazole glycerol phosphate synthase subunit HisH [Phycisphaerae bacterium]HRY70243.1 imidazole glycerol phosphate synthase subunit HisH [Phycisphaerae bacterium]HSA27586.1 imidazole glycerol phosphate synthase subunit HisH [Phycisphaerae bacterium]